MHILLYIAAAAGIFSLATLAWGCLVALRRARAARERRANTSHLGLVA
ncbi:hypothetical protein [Frateuria soli]|nr:hypothetical protein [Frateuria soli]UGB38286.1 hypothetical protein LQ771_00050 [Frateuria soli]